MFGAVAGIIFIKTYLKGAFGLNGFLDIAFLFIEDILHDVQKVSVYILSSINCQTFAVSPAINDLVDIFPHIWCSNSKATVFLGAIFFDFDICFI